MPHCATHVRPHQQPNSRLDRLSQRLEQRTVLVDAIQDAQEIGQASRQSIELPDNDEIAFSDRVEEPLKLWTTGDSGPSLKPDAVSACLDGGIYL
jgi:hypothetical protein